MGNRHSTGSRTIAYIIDMIILSIFSGILVGFGVGNETTVFGFTSRQLSYWQQTLLYLIYFVGFAVLNQGVTIGKIVMGLAVYKFDSSELTQNQLIIREVLKVIFMPIVLISILLVLFRSDNKSLHDLLMDTIVLKGGKQVKTPPNFHRERPQNNDNQYYEDTYNTSEYYDDPAEKEYSDPLENEPYKKKDEDYYE